VADEDIQVPVVDYGEDYPNGYPSKYGHVSFSDLKKGVITVEGKEVPTTPLTSYTLSMEVAEELKRWIQEGTLPADRSPGTHPREVTMAATVYFWNLRASRKAPYEAKVKRLLKLAGLGASFVPATWLRSSCTSAKAGARPT
jgi:hypothetical protein